MADPAEPLGFIAALLLGLLGSSHCIGMCGGIVGALSITTSGQPGTRMLYLVGYNTGRIASYCVAGGLMGLLAAWLGSYHQQFLVAIRTLAGLLLIAMGAYLAGIWFGLTYLEKAGGLLWRHLQPLASTLLPIRHFRASLMAGVVWGWLPCGLVYSTLGWAAGAGNWLSSSILMLGFGLGTLPSMITTGLLAKGAARLARLRGVRLTLGLMIAIYGVWTLVAVYMSTGMSPDHSSMHH